MIEARTAFQLDVVLYNNIMSSILKPNPFRHAIDRLGMTWSGLCAVHCALVPLLFTLMPSLWIALHSHRDPNHGLAIMLMSLGRWEWLFALSAGVIAIASTASGQRRHRRWLPVTLAACGAIVLVAASLVPAINAHLHLHAAVAVCGALLLVAAHGLNLKFVRRAGCSYRQRAAPV